MLIEIDVREIYFPKPAKDKRPSSSRQAEQNSDALLSSNLSEKISPNSLAGFVSLVSSVENGDRHRGHVLNSLLCFPIA
jgi:hypothetical protein